MKIKRGHIGQYSVDLLEREDFDWQSFRAEAAKEFTAALLPVIDWEHTYNENIIKQAIDLADELIKQLKGGEK